MGVGEDRGTGTRWRSAVQRQLARIGHSDTFAGSPRLLRLLDFLTAETLAGRGDGLTENLIGRAVYPRDPPYDPRIDSTVRVEMRRLRQKLAAYYGGEGNRDSIRVDVPVGSYVPLFSEVSTRPAPLGDHAAFFEPGDGVLVAVMPLQPLNRGARAATLAADLSGEIAFALGQEAAITVLAGEPVRRWSEEGRSREDIAARVGVDLFVDGTVKTAGTTVRVTLEVSSANGIVAWADRIDAPMIGGLRLQERIAATLVSHARIDNSLARARRVRPTSVAIGCTARINRARLLLNRQTPSAVREALQRFEQVAEVYPDYARGHSGVADCLCDLYRLDLVDAAQAQRRAAAAARRALDCDPRSVEALTALATQAALFERRPDRAEAGFGEAQALGGGVRAFRGLALLLSARGRHDEAAAAMARARAVEPISTLVDIGDALCAFNAGRFSAVTALARELGRGAAALPLEIAYRAALAHALAGEAAAARALLPLIEAAAPDYPGSRFAAEEIRVRLGDADGGALALVRGGEGSHAARATLALALGDKERALAALTSAIVGREAATLWLAVDPRFAALHGDDRFKALIGDVWNG